jgi:hypothetical protein
MKQDCKADVDLLPHYLRLITHIRSDRTGGWTEATLGHAPHKPLLLAVLETCLPD